MSTRKYSNFNICLIVPIFLISGCVGRTLKGVHDLQISESSTQQNNSIKDELYSKLVVVRRSEMSKAPIRIIAESLNKYLNIDGVDITIVVSEKYPVEAWEGDPDLLPGDSRNLTVLDVLEHMRTTRDCNISYDNIQRKVRIW